MADTSEPRELTSYDELLASSTLQAETWGAADAVAPTLLRAAQKVGGLVGGAFADDGRLVGTVFGLTGLVDDRPVHWSHMLAVTPAARDRGIGRGLKLLQRRWLLARGVEEARWTYDPLEARNAHLNLDRLGAEVVEHQVDFYGDSAGNKLLEGIGTDRFVVRWRLGSERVAKALAGGLPGDGRRAFDGLPLCPRGDDELPAAPRVRVEIPADVQALKQVDLEEARAWRRSTRRAFEHYLARGYRVAAVYRKGERAFYVVEASG